MAHLGSLMCNLFCDFFDLFFTLSEGTPFRISTVNALGVVIDN
jgi:hypothetical protein